MFHFVPICSHLDFVQIHKILYAVKCSMTELSPCNHTTCQSCLMHYRHVGPPTAQRPGYHSEYENPSGGREPRLPTSFKLWLALSPLNRTAHGGCSFFQRLQLPPGRRRPTPTESLAHCAIHHIPDHHTPT